MSKQHSNNPPDPSSWNNLHATHIRSSPSRPNVQPSLRYLLLAHFSVYCANLQRSCTLHSEAYCAVLYSVRYRSRPGWTSMRREGSVWVNLLHLLREVWGWRGRHLGRLYDLLSQIGRLDPDMPAEPAQPMQFLLSFRCGKFTSDIYLHNKIIRAFIMFPKFLSIPRFESLNIRTPFGLIHVYINPIFLLHFID